MLLGIGLFSAFIATITSFMLSSSGAESPHERLRGLADLHRDGLLTDQESPPSDLTPWTPSRTRRKSCHDSPLPSARGCSDSLRAPIEAIVRRQS